MYELASLVSFKKNKHENVAVVGKLKIWPILFFELYLLGLSSNFVIRNMNSG
jgi:hypothetical protein